MRQFLFGIRSFTVGRHRAEDVVEYGMIIATIAVVVLLGVAARRSGPGLNTWPASITTVET